MLLWVVCAASVAAKLPLPPVFFSSHHLFHTTTSSLPSSLLLKYSTTPLLFASYSSSTENKQPLHTCLSPLFYRRPSEISHPAGVSLQRNLNYSFFFSPPPFSISPKT